MQGLDWPMELRRSKGALERHKNLGANRRRQWLERILPLRKVAKNVMGVLLQRKLKNVFPL